MSVRTNKKEVTAETPQQHLQLSEAVPLPLAWRETHWRDDARSDAEIKRIKQPNMGKHVYQGPTCRTSKTKTKETYILN